MTTDFATYLTPSSETLTPEEAQTLAPYFTNTERSVVALVNLPEVVKGALFSRYSRSAKGVRRLFLDEFFGKSELALAKTFEVSETSKVLAEAEQARAKAETFYNRVLSDYGDDSVGELGGAHIAFQEVSQIAAKTIQDHRIGLAFLEKSSRYVPFDDKVNGHYRYYRDRRLLESRYGAQVLEHLDGLFDSYSTLLPRMMAYLQDTHPIDEIEFENAITGDVEKFARITDEEFRKSAAFAYKSAVRAQACDLLRCFLPMATLTNVGVWGNGRALEYLLVNLLADPFAENRLLGRAGAHELDAVIGPFIKRADDDKGKRQQEYLIGRRATQTELAKKYLAGGGNAAAHTGNETAFVPSDAADVGNVTANTGNETAFVPYDAADVENITANTGNETAFVPSDAADVENVTANTGNETAFVPYDAADVRNVTADTGNETTFVPYDAAAVPNVTADTGNETAFVPYDAADVRNAHRSVPSDAADVGNAHRSVPRRNVPSPNTKVTLNRYDTDALDSIAGSILFGASDLAKCDVMSRVRELSDAEKSDIVRAYVGIRGNRRHKPGRAFEHARYEFDLLINIGEFRDLQRHRLVTPDRQPYTTAHGYETSAQINAVPEIRDAYQANMERADRLFREIADEYPNEAQYLIPYGYRVRYNIELNLRELYHWCELRTTEQGHPDYRLTSQQMYYAVRDVHPLLVEGMTFVNLNPNPPMSRLRAEMKSARKRMNRQD